MTGDSLRVSTLRIETYTRGQAATWVTLSGEADIATLAQLEAALAGISLRRSQSLHLHLSDLQFCDAASLRQLKNFAIEARQTGHAVMTCRPSWCVRRVAGLLHYSSHLGLLCPPQG